MYCEALVFMLIVAGIASMQNSLTGVSYYSFPVLVTASSATVAACWAVGVVSLVLVASMTSEFGDGVAAALLRGGRAACGVVFLHVLASAGVCIGHSDPDMCVAVVSGNHMFPLDLNFMYYVFAVSFGLTLSFAIICLLIAQHGTLAVVNKRNSSPTVPRVAWNLNLVLVCLFEFEALLDHNITTAFAPRQVIASWQTLVAVPVLLLLDLVCVKLVNTRLLWSSILVVVVHILVTGAWVTLAFFSSVVRSSDVVYVNIAFAVLQFLAAVGDATTIISGAKASDNNAHVETASAVTTARKLDIFDIPVRSGNRSTSDTRVYRRLELRVKKMV